MKNVTKALALLSLVATTSTAFANSSVDCLQSNDKKGSYVAAFTYVGSKVQYTSQKVYYSDARTGDAMLKACSAELAKTNCTQIEVPAKTNIELDGLRYIPASVDGIYSADKKQYYFEVCLAHRGGDAIKAVQNTFAAQILSFSQKVASDAKESEAANARAKASMTFQENMKYRFEAGLTHKE